MKNKIIIIKKAILLAIASSLSLSNVTIYSQNLWATQHNKVSISASSYPPLSAKGLVISNPSEEFLTVISRNTTGDESTITSTTRSYAGNAALAGSANIKNVKIIDSLTGNLLINYHGANDADKKTIVYDGQERVILQENTEVDLLGNWHTTGQKTAYHLSATGAYVTISKIADSHRLSLGNKVLSWQATHLDGLGRKRFITDSRHGKQATMTVSYNDLGQAFVRTDLLGNTENLYYDAQGQTIKDDKRVQKKANNRDNALPITQLLISTRAIDYVGNTVTSQQHALISHHSLTALRDTSVAACTNTHINTPDNQCTGKRTQKFNDQQKVTQDTLNTQSTGGSLFVTNSRYDNFGNKTQAEQTSGSGKSIDDITSIFTTNVLNNMASVGVPKRKGNKNDDNAINVSFAYDLGGHLIRKIINGQTPYFYQYDSQGNLLKETRFDIKHSGASNGIQQTYNYTSDNTQGNGYVVQRMAWTAIGTPIMHIVETDYYSDIDGQKTLSRKVTPEATIDYTFDYNLHKVVQVTQTSHRTNRPMPDAPTTTITYVYDDTSGQLQSQDNGEGQVIHYQYYPTNNSVMPSALKSRTIAGITTQYEQDGMQLITKVNDIKNVTIATSEVSQDSLGEVTQILRTDRAGQQIDNTVNTYVDQRLTEINFQGINKARGSIRYNRNAHNSRQLTSQIEYSNNSDETITTRYEYDNVNHLSYDATIKNSALTGVNHWQTPITKRIQRHYDAMGNLTKKIDMDNSARSYCYIYDGYNQEIQVSNSGFVGPKIKWDINGNMTQDETGATRRFDDENHEVEYQNQAQTVDVHDQWMDELRISQRVNATVFRYQYANGQLMDTLVQTHQMKAKVMGKQDGWHSVYATPNLRVIEDKQQHVICLQALSIGKNGSVMYSQQINSDGSVKPTDEYHYDADGNLTTKTNKSAINLDIMAVTKLFHGGIHDVVSGEDYKMARFLTTHRGGIRQFTSRDFGQKLLNLNEFANSNTVDYRDPSGHVATALLVTMMYEAAKVALPEEIVAEDIGDFIGSGAYGDVYALKNEDKVVKILHTNPAPWSKPSRVARVLNDFNGEGYASVATYLTFRNNKVSFFNLASPRFTQLCSLC